MALLKVWLHKLFKELRPTGQYGELFTTLRRFGHPPDDVVLIIRDEKLVPFVPKYLKIVPFMLTMWENLFSLMLSKFPVSM